MYIGKRLRGDVSYEVSLYVNVIVLRLVNAQDAPETHPLCFVLYSVMSSLWSEEWMKLYCSILGWGWAVCKNGVRD